MIDPADYTIEFNDVTGWTTPANQTATVTAGQQTTLTGTYVALPTASLTVTIEPTDAVTDGAQWSIDGGSTWLDSGATAADLTPDDYTVQFNDVAGWTTPANQTATVTIGGTICIKSGATDTTTRITTPMRIEACGGPVVLGRGTIAANRAANPTDSTDDPKGIVKITGETGDLLNHKNAVIEWHRYE